MEYPAEILDFIFRQFENIANLRKCYNTCFKWKMIIDGILKDSSIVLRGKKLKFLIVKHYLCTEM